MNFGFQVRYMHPEKLVGCDQNKRGTLTGWFRDPYVKSKIWLTFWWLLRWVWWKEKGKRRRKCLLVEQSHSKKTHPLPWFRDAHILGVPFHRSRLVTEVGQLEWWCWQQRLARANTVQHLDHPKEVTEVEASCKGEAQDKKFLSVILDVDYIGLVINMNS